MQKVTTRFSVGAAALTLALISGLLVAAAAPAGALIHRYSFNDGTANDSVGKANGKLVGGVTVANGAVKFTGKDGERIELLANGPDGINLNTLHAVTVEAWFTVQSDRGWARVFDFGSTVTADGEIRGAQYLFFVPHAASFDDARAVICDKPDRSGEAVAGTDAIAPGAETHVAVVVNEKTLTLYINGAQVAERLL